MKELMRWEFRSGVEKHTPPVAHGDSVVTRVQNTSQWYIPVMLTVKSDEFAFRCLSGKKSR